MSHQRNVKINRYGDTLEVVVRDTSFTKIYQKEVNINDDKALDTILQDLRDKGVDLIGLIKRKMISGDDSWF